MLTLKSQAHHSVRSKVIILVGALLIVGGLYTLSLASAPMLLPAISMRPITPEVLAATPPAETRIIIPKIGVDIEYGEGEVALDNGAQWRWPERGNPYDGGNFIIAAHRFTLAPTPQQTVRQSPFYHIDKLKLGDQIIVDYDGVRYGYEVADLSQVRATQTEIEAPTSEHRLTLYSCGLGGAQDLRHVIFATPLGSVDVESHP